MGIGYVRAKKVIKKECEECGVVWDDDQILHDNGATMPHGYGDDSCPFCHAPWRLDHTLKIPKLKARSKNTMLNKLNRLEERVQIIDAELVKEESTPLLATKAAVKNNSNKGEREGNTNAAHVASLGRISSLRTERVLVLAKIAEFEDKIAKKYNYTEPEDIRLPDGQMDWGAAYRNMGEYRDSL